MSVQRLTLEKQATPRQYSSKPLLTKQVSTTARTITKPIQQDIHPDQTILSFMKSLDGKQAGILNRSIRQGEKLHQPLIKQRLFGVQKPQASNVERQVIVSLQTKIQKLPISEQEFVLRILTSIENGEPKHEELINFFKSKRLLLRINSNYGNISQVGLTSIELFDNNGNLIKINNLYSNYDTNDSLNNLINGHNFTINGDQMWLTDFSNFPITLIICYNLQDDQDSLNSIKIWNYNKNRKELDKCAQQFDILQNDILLKSCILKQGVANTFSEFGEVFQIISMNKDIQSINNNRENSRESRLSKAPSDQPAPFYQSMQSLHSKKSEDKEVNNSKQSSKHAKPKIISKLFPFDDDKKSKKVDSNVIPEPSSVKTKQTVHQQHFFKNPINLFPQKQQTEEDCSSPAVNFKRGVAQIAARFIPTNKSNITIPECPVGSSLLIRLLKNWGDMMQIGLTGIEIFNLQGEKVEINKVSGFFKKPQILFDGIYLTQDDKCMCLERLNKNMEIKIEFQETKVAMIRIWNYNKGRTYINKGVRNLEILLENFTIFKGEIKQANGTCGVDNAEYIMFTNNQTIMNNIQQYDWMNTLHESQIEQQRHILENTVKVKRPDTATFNKPKQENTAQKFTQISNNYQHIPQKSDQIPQLTKQLSDQRLQKKSFSQNIINIKSLPTITVKTITIYLLKNWGDKYIGLDKIDIYDKFGQSLKIKKYKVINPQSQTIMNNDERWQFPNNQIKIQFQFQQFTQISRIIIWNYNKEDELEKGVQLISIEGDNQILNTPQGIYLRKGHGLLDVNDPQIIDLPYTQTIKSILSNYQFENSTIFQDYETTSLPQGTKMQIKLISTWGDLYYIGLNGIEIFDPNGDIINPKLYAKPYSVKDLPQMEMDVRTPDKLLNGINITIDPKSIWLAPFVNSYADRLKTNINSSVFDQISYQVNKIVLLFDTPQQISAISFYNYSKTPLRGVKEIEISIDDNIIYQGYINLSTLTKTPKGINGNNKTTILFTKEERLIEQVGTVSIRDSIIGSETVLINENKRFEINSIKNKELRKQQQGLYKDLNRPTTTQVY